MGFEKIYITDAGANLVKRTLEGIKIEFTKFAIGNGEAPENIETATDLTNKIKDLPIVSIDKEKEKQITIRSLFKNTDISESFYFKELGLYAKDLETQEEVLMAYGNAGDTAEYINNVAPIKEKYIELPIAIGNPENVKIIIDPNVTYVTEKEFKNEIIHTFRLNITQNIADNSEVTIPCNYKVGDGSLLAVILNGEHLIKATDTQDGHYKEVGEEESISNKIQIWQWSSEELGDVRLRAR